MTIPRRTSPQYSRPYNDEEVDDLKIPRAFLVMVRYKDANIASHASILFGDLNMGEEGEIWGLGVEMGTKFEHGIAVIAGNDGILRPAASGALLPTEREEEYRKIVRGLEVTNTEVVSISKLCDVLVGILQKP